MKKRIVFLGLLVGVLALGVPCRGACADAGEVALFSDSSPCADDADESSRPPSNRSGSNKPLNPADYPVTVGGAGQGGPGVDQPYGGEFPAVGASYVELLGFVGRGSDIFTDVAYDSYCDFPVYWAVSFGITNGTTATTFSPGDPCRRRHILAFLYRKEGCPSVAGTDSEDVFVLSELWAKERGLIPEGDFDGFAACTRSEAMVYMWRLSGSPLNGFATFDDVPEDADYERAVAWAVSQGVTKGTSDTTFSPDAPCTRGQIVTFLYRWAG